MVENQITVSTPWDYQLSNDSNGHYACQVYPSFLEFSSLDHLMVPHDTGQIAG